MVLWAPPLMARPSQQKKGPPNFVMDGADDLAPLDSANLVLEGEID